MKKYTLKDFYCSLLVSIMFTVFFVVAYILASIEATDELKIIINLSDTIGVLSVFGVLCLPIILFFSWYMSVERYTYVKLENMEDDEQGKKQFRKKVRRIVIWGIIAMMRTLWHIEILITYWKLLSGMSICILIEVMITAYWLCGWIYHIKSVKSTERQSVSKVWTRGVVILLVVLSFGAAIYTWWVADDVLYHMMVEHYDKYGSYNQPKFYEN